MFRNPKYFIVAESVSSCPTHTHGRRVLVRLWIYRRVLVEWNKTEPVTNLRKSITGLEVSRICRMHNLTCRQATSRNSAFATKSEHEIGLNFLHVLVH